MKAEKGIYPKDRQTLWKTVPTDTPLTVDFMASNVCNFRCNYCMQSNPDEIYTRNRLKKEFIDEEVFKLAVEQLRRFPGKVKTVCLSGYGEPTLNPMLPDMIRTIREAEVAETVLLITNGSRLTPDYSQKLIDAGLSAIRISMQGMSADKYMEVSKAKINWDEFYQNIVHFSKIRKGCKLYVKIADTALDADSREQFFSLFGDICDAVAIEHIHEIFASMGKEYDIPLVRTARTRYGHEAREIKVCWHPFIRLAVHTDGLLTACCSAPLGPEKNIREVPMYEAWNGKDSWINGVRKDFLRHDISRYSPCHKCDIPRQEYHPEESLTGTRKKSSDA